MMKNKAYIKIVAVACLIVIFTIISALILCQKTPLSEKDFPLELDLDKTVFNVGEKISFNATIINKSGKDVNMSSNGEQPRIIFHNINDNTPQGETCMLVEQIFKANEKITKVFEYETIETGTYILDARYSIIVDNISIKHKIDDIIVEVK
jgi:hypothetical protein